MKKFEPIQDLNVNSAVAKPSSEFLSEMLRIDVSIIIPCLNEIESLAHCLSQARRALEILAEHHGLTGEIVVADNGSTDGSQALAESMGAHVVAVARRGYGAALIGGCEGANGRYLLMGDADGSYDFTEGVAMIGRLLDGADLCIGSRFKGGIAPGAMPWKNRYIGNPALTGTLNLLFGTKVDDAHCGLRAIRKSAFRQCRLTSTGMEFASEMIIKASLRQLRIDETPATLSPDLRNRQPHLRPWRDGWRHFRYLLMLSPTWVFGIPAMAAMCLATVIFLVAGLYAAGFVSGVTPFGTSWTILAGFLMVVGHFAALMSLTTHLYGVQCGYRRFHPLLAWLKSFLTLEHCLAVGASMMIVAIMAIGAVGIQWGTGGFVALPSVLPLVLALALGTVGLQTVFGGFLLAIIGGHEAQFGNIR